MHVYRFRWLRLRLRVGVDARLPAGESCARLALLILLAGKATSINKHSASSRVFRQSADAHAAPVLEHPLGVCVTGRRTTPALGHPDVPPVEPSLALLVACCGADTDHFDVALPRQPGLEPGY